MVSVCMFLVGKCFCEERGGQGAGPGKACQCKQIEIQAEAKVKGFGIVMSGQLAGCGGVWRSRALRGDSCEQRKSNDRYNGKVTDSKQKARDFRSRNGEYVTGTESVPAAYNSSDAHLQEHVPSSLLSRRREERIP